MKSLETYLGCGSLEITRREVVNFIVRKLSCILTKIIPFFLEYNIKGEKSLDFQDWCKVADLMKGNKHLTKEGIEQIRSIKSSMNTARNS